MAPATADPSPPLRYAPSPFRRQWSPSSSSWQWHDVTGVFREAREQLDIGELVHNDSFSLHTAMSAIELMDPKMDIGFGHKRNVTDVALPPALSDAQLVNVLDYLLAAEMSWLDAHTLPQSVFACVYVQRMSEVPRFELIMFLRVLMGTMDSILNLIADEKVADEEDFVTSLYGFNLMPLAESETCDDHAILERMWKELEYRPLPIDEVERSYAVSIALRIRMQIEFYRVVQCMSAASLEGSRDHATGLLNGLQNLVQEWESCPYRATVDGDFMATVFDPSVNRHLMTSSPPRTAPLFDLDDACQYFKRILIEMASLVELEPVSFPAVSAAVHNGKSSSQRNSLHVAIHSVVTFCAELNPTILTRSFLARIMIPEYSSFLFGNKGADFAKLLGTDVGLESNSMSVETIADLRTCRPGVLKLFTCLCNNRSRRRRNVLGVIRWWDQYSVTAIPRSDCESGKAVVKESTNECGQGATTRTEGDWAALSSQPNEVKVVEGNLFTNMSALQVVACEVSARLMIQHWLLGFECDLYQEYEYAGVFFYIGYVLTTMTNATTSLANKADKGASLHPLRFALYTMDEGRLWMCRATYSTLDALSRGPVWNYSRNHTGKHSSKGGSVTFGSEELWYSQRFGVLSDVVAGPLYADYAAYRSFQEVQEKSLLKNSDETDIVILLFQDAAKGFLVARRTLEKAKKAAAGCGTNKISAETLQLARVAVENSLALSRILQIQEAARLDPQSAQTHNIEFTFDRHRHFPVIHITNG